jgi:hypothetical protein
LLGGRITLVPLIVPLTVLFLYKDLLRVSLRALRPVVPFELQAEVGQLLIHLTPCLRELVKMSAALGVGGPVTRCRLLLGGAC